jgi:multicomponent Na+:H+ antiporter subunit E
MRAFLWNLALAFSWAMATGEFTLGNVLVGFVLGYFVLLVGRRVLAPTGYFTKVSQVVRFAFFYLGQLILSNLRIAYDIVTPTHHMRPAVLAVPLDAHTDLEIMLLANLITLTPGTLSLDVSLDRSVIYIHAMYVDDGDLDAARLAIKQGLERRVLEVLR